MKVLLSDYGTAILCALTGTGIAGFFILVLNAVTSY